MGETEGNIVVPFEVWMNEGEKTMARLVDLVRSELIEQIVVGAPLPQGTFHTSKQLEATRRFIERLRLQISLPIHEEDEAYTSWQSRMTQKQPGVHAKEDALAAMYILEQFLNRPSV